MTTIQRTYRLVPPANNQLAQIVFSCCDASPCDFALVWECQAAERQLRHHLCEPVLTVAQHGWRFFDHHSPLLDRLAEEPAPLLPARFITLLEEEGYVRTETSITSALV